MNDILHSYVGVKVEILLFLLLVRFVIESFLINLLLLWCELFCGPSISAPILEQVIANKAKGLCLASFR